MNRASSHDSNNGGSRSDSSTGLTNPFGAGPRMNQMTMDDLLRVKTRKADPYALSTAKRAEENGEAKRFRPENLDASTRSRTSCLDKPFGAHRRNVMTEEDLLRDRFSNGTDLAEEEESEEAVSKAEVPTTSSSSKAVEIFARLRQIEEERESLRREALELQKNLAGLFMAYAAERR